MLLLVLAGIVGAISATSPLGLGLGLVLLSVGAGDGAGHEDNAR